MSEHEKTLFTATVSASNLRQVGSIALELVQLAAAAQQVEASDFGCVHANHSYMNVTVDKATLEFHLKVKSLVDQLGKLIVPGQQVTPTERV